MPGRWYNFSYSETTTGAFRAVEAVVLVASVMLAVAVHDTSVQALVGQYTSSLARIGAVFGSLRRPRLRRSTGAQLDVEALCSQGCFVLSTLAQVSQ